MSETWKQVEQLIMITGGLVLWMILALTAAGLIFTAYIIVREFVSEAKIAQEEKKGEQDNIDRQTDTRS